MPTNTGGRLWFPLRPRAAATTWSVYRPPTALRSSVRRRWAPPVTGYGQRNRSCGRATGPQFGAGTVHLVTATHEHRTPASRASVIISAASSVLGGKPHPQRVPQPHRNAPGDQSNSSADTGADRSGRGLCRWCKSCTPRPDCSRSARPYRPCTRRCTQQLWCPSGHRSIDDQNRIIGIFERGDTILPAIGGAIAAASHFARASRCCSLSGVRCPACSASVQQFFEPTAAATTPSQRRSRSPPPPSGRTAVRSWGSSPPAGPATDHGLCQICGCRSRLLISTQIMARQPP